MAKPLERQYFYKRCILPALHFGDCEWNDFDPPEEYVRCFQYLYQSTVDLTMGNGFA